MFFHFSQLEGWSAEDVKVGDDVEYTIRRDRNDPNKLSAVQASLDVEPGAAQGSGWRPRSRLLGVGCCHPAARTYLGMPEAIAFP